MLKLLLLFLLAMPVQAGVILKDSLMTDSNKSKQWVYDDGVFRVILLDRQTKECGDMRLMRLISVGNYVKTGCWYELDALVFIQYENGQESAISVYKFRETKIDNEPVLKTKNSY